MPRGIRTVGSERIRYVFDEHPGHRVQAFAFDRELRVGDAPHEFGL